MSDVRLTEGENPHHVSSQGRKRKRPGGEHASARNSSSADSRNAEQHLQQQNRNAQKSRTNNQGSLQRINGDKHSASGPDHKSKALPHHVPTQNGIHAAQQRYASLAEKRNQLLTTRKKLPIWPHADKIRQSLRGDKNVMLLVGETGSGKSTQVPQFLLSEKWCKGCIAVTQPRRVAAISLARRVAEEMGTPLGSSSPASKVGYSVRFDNSVSPNTKVKFLTEGMLLQELLRDPSLKQYSAVIVDEVHERSVNVDLILGFLRNLVRGDKSGRNGQTLKVAVMSATADVQKLYDFFEADDSVPPIASFSLSSDEHPSSDASWGGVSDDDEAVKSSKKMSKSLSGSNGTAKTDLTSICYIEGRQYPVQTTYLSEASTDFIESALKAVFELHMKEPLPGDILVFLTGQDTVEGLERLINEYAETMDPALPKVSALDCSVRSLTN